MQNPWGNIAKLAFEPEQGPGILASLCVGSLLDNNVLVMKEMARKC